MEIELTHEAATAKPQSVLDAMAARYGMAPDAFKAVVLKTCMPDCHVNIEQLEAFLVVASEYQLNPLTREIYAQNTPNGIQPTVTVDGWATLINSNPAFDGMSFKDHLGDNGELISITCIMYRKDRNHPVEVTEYLEECQDASETWQKWPRRRLRHKAMIQAGRYAFSLSGIYDPDEIERINQVQQKESKSTFRERIANRADNADEKAEGFTSAQETMAGDIEALKQESESDAHQQQVEGREADESACEAQTHSNSEGTQALPEEGSNVEEEPAREGDSSNGQAAEAEGCILDHVRAVLDSNPEPEAVGALRQKCATIEKPETKEAAHKMFIEFAKNTAKEAT